MQNQNSMFMKLPLTDVCFEINETHSNKTGSVHLKNANGIEGRFVKKRITVHSTTSSIRKIQTILWVNVANLNKVTLSRRCVKKIRDISLAILISKWILVRVLLSVLPLCLYPNSGSTRIPPEPASQHVQFHRITNRCSRQHYQSDLCRYVGWLRRHVPADAIRTAVREYQ